MGSEVRGLVHVVKMVFGSIGDAHICGSHTAAWAGRGVGTVSGYVKKHEKKRA